MSGLEDELRQVIRNQQQIQFLIQQLRDKRSEYELKMQSVIERARIEFGIENIHLADGEVEQIENPEEYEEKVERLRTRLQNFGDINPMALDAFEEMKLRYDNIREQRQDILEAKESLLNTIQEIEEQATAPLYGIIQ